MILADYSSPVSIMKQKNMVSINEYVRNSILIKRREAGITQEELANHIGASQSFIHQIESGKKIPNLNTINNIAIALKCNLHDLIPINPIQQQGEIEDERL